MAHEARPIVLGIGFSSDVTLEEVVALGQRVLASVQIAKPHAIASLDLKRDAPIWAALAARFGCAVEFFDATRLEAETPRLRNPSEAVFRAVGCHGVAEAAALAGSGPTGALVVAKMASRHATAALAMAL